MFTTYLQVIKADDKTAVSLLFCVNMEQLQAHFVKHGAMISEFSVNELYIAHPAPTPTA